MISDLSSVEYTIIEHALGLNQANYILYRNRYLAHTGSAPDRVLRALEERGHVRFVRVVEDSNLRVYEVTPSTITLMTEELHG